MFISTLSFSITLNCLQCQINDINGSFEIAPILFLGSLLFPTLPIHTPTVPSIIVSSHIRPLDVFNKIPYFLLFILSHVPWTPFPLLFP